MIECCKLWCGPREASIIIVRACQEFTWNQVFMVIDRLSRDGALRLVLKERGCYEVYLGGDTSYDARQDAGG